MAIVNHQGQLISFEDVGAGPAVVLNHSFLCSGKMWREQVPSLARNHRVLNLDFRGHGGSSEVTQPFSLYDAVSDVVAVLDDLGIEKAVWCGLSIGGMVALRAALTCPDRVEALILLDTDAGAEVLMRKLKYRGMGLAARVSGLGPLLSPIARLMFGATTRRENPRLVAEWKREFSTVHIPSVLQGLEALMKRDSVLPQLSEIAVPTLVLVGEEDGSLPPPLSRRIHDSLRDSRFVQVPAAGHLSALEQPLAVTESLLDFLNALPR